MALGRASIRKGSVIHEFSIRDVHEGFNTSHTINRLTFGDPPCGGIAEYRRRGSLGAANCAEPDRNTSFPKKQRGGCVKSLKSASS